MDVKNDGDNLDNALKIMNNLFQLTEEFVNDTPNDGNQTNPNTSTLDSSSSSKPTDSTTAPGLKFPELPDPEIFFESIVTNSTTTSEPSKHDSLPVTSSSSTSKKTSSSSTIKVGPVLYPRPIDPNGTDPKNPILGSSNPSVLSGSSQSSSNIHQSNTRQSVTPNQSTGQVVQSNQNTGNTNQQPNVVKSQTINPSSLAEKKPPVTVTPYGNLKSELVKVAKKTEMNAICAQYSNLTYSDDVNLMISKHLESSSSLVNNAMLQKNNIIVNFINKIKTGGGVTEELVPSKESSSNNESSSTNKETTSTVKQNLQKKQKKRKLNSKTVEFDEGDVMLTPKQITAIQAKPTITRRRLTMKHYTNDNEIQMIPNNKKLIKVDVKSLLLGKVNLKEITKNALTEKALESGTGIDETSGTSTNKEPIAKIALSGKQIDGISTADKNKQPISSQTTPSQAMKTGQNEMEINPTELTCDKTEVNKNKTESTLDKIETKGKTNPVDNQSEIKEIEIENTEQNTNSGAGLDSIKNNDNISSKRNNAETISNKLDSAGKTNNALIDESKDGSNIDQVKHDTIVLDDKETNENTIDKKPSIQIDEDDEILVLEVPEKVFPLIDILSDDEDNDNNIKQNKNTDQEEDVLEISIDNELKKSIDGIPIVDVGAEEDGDENSEYKQLTNVSNIEKGTNMNKHLERNMEGEKLKKLNPALKSKTGFNANNNVKGSERNQPKDNNKVSDENNFINLKRKNEKDDSLIEIEGKKRKDCAETIGKDGQIHSRHMESIQSLEGQEMEENNQSVDGTMEVAEDATSHIMSDQSRIQDSAILNLINEVKMSTRQQRKQDSTGSSHENLPPSSKPSIRDRLGDKLSIKDRIGPIDNSITTSSRTSSGGLRIRDRLGGKVEEDDDGDREEGVGSGGGGGLAIRIQIENELVTSGGTEMDLGLRTSDDVLLSDQDDTLFIRQVLIEPPSSSNITTDEILPTTDGEPYTHASPTRYSLSPNQRENLNQSEDNFSMRNEVDFPPMMTEDDDFPMFNEADPDGGDDGFQTLSEAESEDREERGRGGEGGGSDDGRNRKRRSAKDRLGRRVESSEDEEHRRSPPSHHHHHHRRHSGSSQSRSPGHRVLDSRPYVHVSRHKLVRDRQRRDSSSSRRDKSRESPSRLALDQSPSRREENSLERRRKSLERREKSLERREKERLARHADQKERESRSKLTRDQQRSRYKWSRDGSGGDDVKKSSKREKKKSIYKWSRPDGAEENETGRENQATAAQVPRSRDLKDPHSNRSSRNVQPRNVGRNRWGGPAQQCPPPPPQSNLIELTGQPGPPPMGFGPPPFDTFQMGPMMMEHQIPTGFLDATAMPMQDMSQQPPNMMSQQPFQMTPYNQPPPLYFQPPPNFSQQPPGFMPQAPSFPPPSTAPFMGVPPPAMVPPPTMVPPPSATASLTQSVGSTPDPTDANFTYAFIEQNISKVKANLMNKIDKSKSKVDEYFEKFKVNEPQKDSGSGRGIHGGRKSQDRSGKKDSDRRRRSSSSEIRSVSPENRSSSARSRSRSRHRRSRSSRDSRPRNRYTRSPESEVKTSRQSLERRDSLNRQNSDMGTHQGDNTNPRNSVETRTSPLNDREIDLLYRDLIRRRNEDTRRPPSVISLSPSPPLELGSRFRGVSPSLLEQVRPSHFGLQERSLLENRDSREKLPEPSAKRQRSSGFNITPSISELLSTARRCQQLASQSSDLFTAPPANRSPPLRARSPPLIRPRTPSPPSPPRYDRLPRPARVQINLSPMRFSRSPSLEIDPWRQQDSRRDLDPRQPSSRRPRSPLRLSPPNLRWSQSPSPPPTSSRERVWYSRSPDPSQGREQHSREHSQGREDDFYGNRANARHHHPAERSRFDGNREDTRPLPLSDARHLIRSRDERSMSFSISPSPDRRRARSSSSDFVNPLDLVDNPGIPGEDDCPTRDEFY